MKTAQVGLVLVLVLMVLVIMQGQLQWTQQLTSPDAKLQYQPKDVDKRSVLNVQPAVSSSVPRIPTDEERARYQTERNATTQQPTIEHRGVAGLGHRLGRMSGLFHASKTMNLTRMAASWGWECGPNENGDPDIFDHLFGRGPMVVRPLQPNAMWTDRPKQYQDAPKKTLRVVNDAPGYQPLCAVFGEKRKKHVCTPTELTREKLVSDVEFFHQLRVLFRFNDEARSFMKQFHFSEHTVIGLHVRGGNGEKTRDWLDKGRGFSDIETWLNKTAKSLKDLSAKLGRAKPPMIFLATDTPSVIQKLQTATRPHGIRVVAFQQELPQEGAGVSFDKKFNLKKEGAGAACRRAWVDQFIDATLLSASDVVVSGQYSSFTQTTPLITILTPSILAASHQPPSDVLKEHAKRLYCEMTFSGSDMKCFDDALEWVVENTWQRKELIVPWGWFRGRGAERCNSAACLFPSDFKHD